MIKQTVSSDLHRAISGRGFLIGVVGMILVIALGAMQAILTATKSGTMLPNGTHAQLVLDALSSGWVTLALPVLCALPYTSSFVDDIKSGFIKQYLHRSGVGSYIEGKTIACALSGGLVLFVGVLCAYGISALVFVPMELAKMQGEAMQSYFVQILMKAAVLFFSGAFWSLVGFTCAALTLNRFIAYAAPFILYYVLIILHERYFESLYVLYPKEWIAPSSAWVLGNWGIVLLLIEMTIAVGLLFALTAKRRLSNV